MSNATTYFSSFDDSAFAAYENVDSTRLNSDSCEIKAKNNDNLKKLKYITTNNIDLIQASDKLNFFAIGLKDQLFVPSDKVDYYSNLLNGQNGGQLTNKNERRGIEFGQLPVNIPFRGQVSHGDIDIEDNIRNNVQVKKHSCLPIDTNYHDRSFTIFDEKLGIEVPNGIKSVETPEQGFWGGRVGMSSRFCKRFSK